MWKWILSFYHVHSRGQTQVNCLESHYPLCNLASQLLGILDKLELQPECYLSEMAKGSCASD